MQMHRIIQHDFVGAADRSEHAALTQANFHNCFRQKLIQVGVRLANDPGPVSLIRPNLYRATCARLEPLGSPVPLPTGDYKLPHPRRTWLGAIVLIFSRLRANPYLLRDKGPSTS